MFWHKYSQLSFKSMLKICQFKTWCKGDKSNIENSTDHFCEDNRENALVAVTNLGHITPFQLFGPYIKWSI